MSERKLIVDHLKFEYEGLFRADEVFNIIQYWFYEKQYDWHEKVNQEIVTPKGKQIRVVLENWKNVSEYYKLIQNIKLVMSDVREVEVEQKGKKIKLHHGVVRIIFDGHVYSDRKGTWTDTPVRWLMTIIFEHYFFQDHFKKIQDWLVSDVDDLYHKLKDYLNVYKYQYQI